MTMKKLCVVLALVAMLFVITGCSSSSISSSTVNGVSTVNVNVSNADGDVGDADVTVNAGEQLVIAPQLKSGSVNVQMVPANGGAAVLTKDVSGSSEVREAVDAGDYKVKVSAKGASGTVKISTSAN